MHGVGRPKNYDIRAVQTHAFHEPGVGGVRTRLASRTVRR
jgi:hypothetical protein